MSGSVLCCLANDRAYTLTRIVGLCARRACVIESVSAQRTGLPGVIAVTLVVEADPKRLANLAGQLARLVDVLSVEAGDAPRPGGEQDWSAAGQPACQGSPPSSTSTVSRPTSDSSRYGA